MMKFLKHDVRRHLVYTIFIIIISSAITFLLINLKFRNFNSLINNTKQQLESVEQNIPNSQNAFYVEKGSPYDNRILEGSVSAKIYFHGPRDKKKVALTFDAEMTDLMRRDLVSGKVKSLYDKRIVDVLNQTQTKATLFLTGMWIELYPKETAQFSQNPLFELGSHSYTDSSYFGFCYGLKQLSNTVKIEDIGVTEKLLREHAGIDNQLFRFPGGCYTPVDVKLVADAGDVVVHWDVSGADGFNQSSRQIIRNVVDNVQNGSIIILHLNGAPNAPKTAEALPAIINTLKAKGFEFVKVSELLGLPPESRVSQ